MDRKRQVANVSFGGEWSEAIVPRERVQQAIEILERATADSEETDPRTPEVSEALEVVGMFARGPMLGEAFFRAACLPNPGLRRKELARIVRTISSVIGAAKH